MSEYQYYEFLAIDRPLSAADMRRLRDDDDDGTGWMASLAPLRNDIIDGDYRSLYLAWLLIIQCDALTPATREPPVPPGLGALPAPCEALADFLHLDRTLLGLAAEQSPPRVAAEVSGGDWRIVLADLTAAERDELLSDLLIHDDPATRRNLRKRLRSSISGAAAEPGAAEHCRASGSSSISAWQ
ncbi:MAG: hypothetical protein KKB50_03655 [Planctomycetes bacterium]|nr:hypothetical protein [Planctomycetota bacterium]